MNEDLARSNSVEHIQASFLLRIGRMYVRDPIHAQTATKAIARAMLLRLDSVSIHKLLHVTAKRTMDMARRVGEEKEFIALRKYAGEAFEQIGVTNQHSPSSAACYAIYLLAGCFNEPNVRLAVYAIADAFGWVEKAGEDMEGLWAQINLLLD